MKSNKETILDMYFIEHLKPVDIAKELSISKSAVTQVLQKDEKYSTEKERRKAENYKKHIKDTEERNTRVRKEKQFKNSVDDLVLKTDEVEKMVYLTKEDLRKIIDEGKMHQGHIFVLEEVLKYKEKLGD